MNEIPPPGIIGYAVFTHAGVRHALLLERSQAEAYASRMGGFWYPLVCGRRKDDPQPERNDE